MGRQERTVRPPDGHGVEEIRGAAGDRHFLIAGQAGHHQVSPERFTRFVAAEVQGWN